MSPKPYLTKHKCFLLLLLILSLLALHLTCTLHSSSHRLLPQFNGYLSRNSHRNLRELPSWYKFLANKFIDRKMRIGLVNVKFQGGLLHEENVDIVNVKFQRVSEKIEWNHLFPGWIDEDNAMGQHECPTVPIPDLGKYKKLDVVVARVPCGRNSTRDVYRLQVNLIVANLLVKCGWNNHDVHQTGYAVFIGECEPMFEIFRCNDLLWHQKDVRIYKPSLTKLKQKLVMPVGSCQLARPFAEQGKEIWRRYGLIAAKRRIYKPREAYVTVLHSSEAYVCGAITLAQSIIQSNSTRDLILLADSSISPKSLRALQQAGWKIKPIQRIRSPHAKNHAYNEWNYSKLRIWEQLTEYEKAMFVDSDVVVFKNMDEFFVYPELSAAKNHGHLFNSGVMIVEPSKCTFESLMEKRPDVVSYNGGDQGFLNEMFAWWHRLPMRVNRLKVFTGASGNQHALPEDVYAIHYLGLKPWKCSQDYDCNWDKVAYQKFASDSAFQRWRQVYNKMPEGLREFCAPIPKMNREFKA
ncbi:putative UDP-glucuronate:xylan alpha-glucuronosyltransferase 4 [Ipomoea triloba]|uniref:putative UDP-glucuronate:xylan alpha-glucuronosyltransferase 4 n=1 Tax=Ipomoea triloba TaxID=35885 RepID=UPI00125D937C|nr:putative UDP-glucuronate:xylan alpha-glucuronosyltransferase 4 [Ipomoea triloba]